MPTTNRRKVSKPAILPAPEYYAATLEEIKALIAAGYRVRSSTVHVLPRRKG